MANKKNELWALILGASSGFGAATARALAAVGYNIAGVHLDRRGTMSQVEKVIDEIKAHGVEAKFFNINAADEDKRAIVIGELCSLLTHRGEMGNLRVIMHSLAFGALRSFVDKTPDGINPQQLEMTLDVMANTLVYWAQPIISSGMMGEGGRIFAMTSAGSHRVWRDYGAVSAAKAALEAHVRQLAAELAPRRITVNALQAGITDTPALRKIANCEEMIARGLQLNPHGRLTTPEDVAGAIVALASPGTAWITGSVIRVDGGEDIIG